MLSSDGEALIPGAVKDIRSFLVKLNVIWYNQQIDHGGSTLENSLDHSALVISLAQGLPKLDHTKPEKGAAYKNNLPLLRNHEKPYKSQRLL